MRLGRKVDDELPRPPRAEIPEGNTMITLQNTYGRWYRWTDLSVQDVALRIRNSEPIPLTEGDWLSPWNIDTYMTKEKWFAGAGA